MDGGEKLQLTSTSIFVYAPSWSPDGRQIAFSAVEPGRPFRLYLISADGGNPHEVQAGEFNVGPVSWAPDGNSIAFEDASGPAVSFIRSVDLKTSKVSTLPLPESTQMLSPARSPDGHYLVAATSDAQKLMLFDYTIGKWSELANMSIGYTHWSADAKYVYFDTGYTADPAVYRVRITDHKLERLASLKDFRRVVVAWTAWSGVTPDGSPLLMHDIGTQEVYALDLEVP